MSIEASTNDFPSQAPLSLAMLKHAVACAAR